MNARKISWRHALAAALATPILAMTIQSTRSAEPFGDRPAAAAERERSPEARREAEELRIQGAVRLLEERATDVEKKLRDMGDDHPDQSANLKRELTELRERMQQLRKREGSEGRKPAEAIFRELQERISATERVLQGLGEGHPEKAESLERELDLMREKLRQLKERGMGEGRERMEGAVRELQERGSAIERELRELGDRHPERAEALKREAMVIRERLQRLRGREGEERPRLPENAFRELRERTEVLERELRELGDNHPDRTQVVKRELAELHEKLRQLSRTAERDMPPPAMREIEELRAQVRELRGQVEALKAEVRRLAERQPRDRE